jgi:hypothetical protein
MLFVGSVLSIPGTVEAVKEIHDVSILNVFISEKYLECKKDAFVSIQLKNEGIENEYVHVEISNQELGIDEFAPIIMVQPNGLESISIPIIFPEEPEGSHEFEVLAYFNNEVKRYFKSFDFKGCPEAPTQPKSINLASDYASPKVKEEGISAHTWYLVGMVVLIFILAIIYLLKIYIEKTRSKA